MLEVRVPIAPDAAVLMNSIDRNDEGGVPMKRRAAAELNAFTITQARKIGCTDPVLCPEMVDAVFLPLSRLIDPAYHRAVAEQSARPAHAQKVPQVHQEAKMGQRVRRHC